MSEINWEALVRAIRTFLQGILAAGVVSAYDAIQGALNNGVGFDVKKLVTIAVAAFVAGVVSYLMNVLMPPKSVRKDVQQ